MVFFSWSWLFPKRKPSKKGSLENDTHTCPYSFGWVCCLACAGAVCFPLPFMLFLFAGSQVVVVCFVGGDLSWGCIAGSQKEINTGNWLGLVCFERVKGKAWLLLGNIFPIFAYCGLVENPDLTAKVSDFLLPKPSVNQEGMPSFWGFQKPSYPCPEAPRRQI